MKAYKFEIFIIDFDDVGEDGIKSVIENTHYPNRCIDPEVKAVESRDIGEWSDDHPLNMLDKQDDEYRRIFSGQDPSEPN